MELNIVKNILVVEDDKALREGIELALRREDFHFTLCESIAGAKKELAKDKLIDRIWTDGAEYVDENALSVTVGRLRSKLKENGEGHLQTVYGI